MRRLALLVAAVLSLLVLAACGNSQALPETEILSVRNRSNNKIISIGDTQQEADQVTGGDMENIMDLEDGGLRCSYRNAEGIFIEYDADGIVRSFRLCDNDNWETAGGVRIGMPRDDAEEVYAGNTYKEPGMSGGVLMSYDENLQPAPFSEEEPYMIILSFEDDKVSYVTIEAME